MRKVLITGANGQLGSRLSELVLPDEASAVVCDRKLLDVTNSASIQEALDKFEPEVVINAAAYTAVDRAEEEAELARAVNSSGVGHLARICSAKGIDLIHVSTDYVFSGDQNEPYRTNDAPAPKGVYGDSKWEGEKAISEAFLGATQSQFWIFRVAWLYDSRGQNFAQTMLRLGASGKALKIVDDQLGAPTAAGPLASMLMEVAQDPKLLNPGMWHYGTLGPATWYDFAMAIFAHKKMDVDATPCGSDAYPTPAKRPAYSYLDPHPLMQALGRSPQHWKDQMQQVL
jgi:dTDP-4-dehydrorhamnose reductase